MVDARWHLERNKELKKTIHNNTGVLIPHLFVLFAADQVEVIVIVAT